MSASGKAAPTGCYKCGRPGHWSRDCRSNPDVLAASASETQAPLKSSSSNGQFRANSRSRAPPAIQKPRQKNTRPKLTPELLLSDAGIGRILRYFPKAFKYHGRGHEVDDLGHLLLLYAEWHSLLLPYYNFNQFVHKVEEVGATRRVKVCIGDLRDKVSHGIEPTDLQPKQNPADRTDDFGNMDMSTDVHFENEQDEGPGNLSPRGVGEKSTKNGGGAEEKSFSSLIADETAAVKEVLSNQNQISDEQKARMEANKRKALERAAARSRLSRS